MSNTGIEDLTDSAGNSISPGDVVEVHAPHRDLRLLPNAPMIYRKAKAVYVRWAYPKGLFERNYLPLVMVEYMEPWLGIEAEEICTKAVTVIRRASENPHLLTP